jgi:hypothetical protein
MRVEGLERLSVAEAIARGVPDWELSDSEIAAIWMSASGLYAEQMQDGRFHVTIENTSESFDSLSDAAQYLRAID